MTERLYFTHKPRITVPEARKLLGRKYDYLSDDQVLNLIFTLTLLARKNLKYIGSNITLGSDSIE